MIRGLVLTVGTAALLAGCGAVPTGSSPSTSPETTGSAVPGPERLVAIVGTVGAMFPVTPGSDGRLDRVAGTGLPPDAAWLSGDGSRLVATTLAGQALIGDSASQFQAAPGDLGSGHPARMFGSLGPRRVAFVEGDPGSGGPGHLVLATLDGAAVQSFALPTPAEGPPAWLPDGRIVVVVRDREDRPLTLLVDPATGRVATLATDVLRFVATGGDLVATIDADGATRVGPVDGWLHGAPLTRLRMTLPSALPLTLPLGLPSAPDDGAALMASPSPGGRELAVVVADAAGDAASIRILAAAGGWHEIARFELPSGANRAIVSWLAAR